MDKTITEKPNSYKVACKTRGDQDWSFNGLRFKTEDEAKRYGADLFSRWTALDKYEIHISEDVPNYAADSQGRVKPIEAPKGYEDSGVLLGPV